MAGEKKTLKTRLIQVGSQKFDAPYSLADLIITTDGKTVKEILDEFNVEIGDPKDVNNNIEATGLYKLIEDKTIDTSTLQLKEDNSLITTDKTVVGSINELKDIIDNIYYIKLEKDKNNIIDITNDIIQNQIDEAYNNGYRHIIFPKNETIQIIDIDSNGTNSDKKYMPKFIKLHSNTIYDLNGSTIKIKKNDYTGYTLFDMTLLKNTILQNGILIGDKEEHEYKTDSSNEWGCGVIFNGSKNCMAVNLEIKNMIGDGASISNIISHYSTLIQQSDMEIGKINETDGTNVDDVNSYRTSKYLDFNDYINDYDKNNGISLNNKLILYPGNPHGYGPYGQFIRPEVYVIYYNELQEFISSKKELLCSPIEIPKDARYFKYYFPNKDMENFTNQSMMIRIGEISEACFIENCNIHHCRRQGVTISASIGCGVKDTIISDIKGTNPQACIDIEDGGNTTTGVIIDNVIMKNSRIGVSLYDGKYHQVSNSYIENCNLGITVGYSIGFSIKDTVFNKTSLFIGHGVTEGYRPEMGVIDNCNFINCSNIETRNEIKISINNCTIYNPTNVTLLNVNADNLHMLYKYWNPINYEWENSYFKNCIFTVENVDQNSIIIKIKNIIFENCKFKEFAALLNGGINKFINCSGFRFAQALENTETYFVDCNIDTLPLSYSENNCKLYFKNCNIVKHTDHAYGLFILPNYSFVLFENCDIYNEQGSFLLRNDKVQEGTTDVIFRNCNIISDTINTTLFSYYVDGANVLIADCKLTNIKVSPDRPNYIDEDNIWRVK